MCPKRPDHEPHDTPEDTPTHRRCAHTFIVRVTAEPPLSPTSSRRWHGEFEHVHGGKRVGHRRFTDVERLLARLAEAVRRAVGLTDEM